MALTINKGIDPLANARDTPRARWPELVTARKYHCLGNIPTDCRALLKMVADAEDCEWLGYGSRQRYMREGLDLDPVAVDLAVGFLRAADLIVPIEFETAIEGGRRLRAQGDNQHNKEGIELQYPTIKPGSTEYIRARLDRDAPALAAEVRAGTKSAHAAAIEAGFRKKPSPLRMLRSAWKLATAAERAVFLKEVG